MKKILIIEDCPFYMGLIKLLLSPYPVKICYCTSVEKAENTKCIDDYDLIISDYNLPGKNGFEFLKSIRINKPNIPLVLMTANRNVKKECSSLNTIVNNLIFKPFAHKYFEGIFQKHLGITK